MSSDSKSAPRRRFPPFLINSAYTRLWYGQSISVLGDAVFSTTLVLWVATVLAKGKPWAPAAVSGVLLATGAAVLLIGPFAGVFVDRWDSRRTLLRSELARCLIAGLLAAVSFLPVRDLPAWAWLTLVCADVFTLNVAGQFFGPARYTIIRDIVHGDADRARAAGIAQATAGTAMIAGPPLAAPLLFTVGVQWALLFNAASYAVSFFAIRSVRPGPGAAASEPAGERAKLTSEFAAGLRFFGRSRFLVALLVLAVIGQCGAGALQALNVFFVSANLHAPAHLYGYLGTGLGVGGITGALFAGRVVKRIGARRTAWTGLVLGGILLVCYSRQSALLGGVCLLFLFAVPITMLNTAMAPLLLGSAPREYMGRVVAVYYPVTQLAGMLSTLLAGWLVSSVLRNFTATVGGVRFGPIDTIFAVSGLLIVIAGCYARAALPETTDEPAAAVTAAEEDLPVLAMEQEAGTSGAALLD
jgi:MFS family permease